MTAEWQLCNVVDGVEREEFTVELDPVVSKTVVSFAAAGLDRLRSGLQQAGLDPSTFPWPPANDPERVPYRGLRPLEAEDAAIFFGRDAAIVSGLDALRTLRERAVEGMFVILGSSGAGKSSFLRAGLWPRLERDDRHFLPLPVVRPERAAITGATGLAAALEAAFRRFKIRHTRGELREAVASPAGFDALLRELRTAATARLDSDAAPPTILIAVDQGEELFGTDGRREAEALLTLLGSVLGVDATRIGPLVRVEDPQERADRQAHHRVLVVIGIRSDSYELLQTHPLLAPVKSFVFSLPPIARAEFKSVIEGPAMRRTQSGKRLTVDPRLTAQLLQDTDGPDALPLLAFTLERLLLEYGGDDDLSHADYVALGGVSGSIEAGIDAALADPARSPVIPAEREEQERLLRTGFVPWLARIDPETEERKRRVARWDEVPDDAKPLLERLIEQRLLLRDRRDVDGSGVETVVVEVAHEALLRRWPALTAWLDRDAESLKAIDAAKRSASDWCATIAASLAGAHRNAAPARRSAVGAGRFRAPAWRRRPCLSPRLSATRRRRESGRGRARSAHA